jgi:hypothetical protein
VSLAAPASPHVPSGTAEEGKNVMTVQIILDLERAQVWLGSNKGAFELLAPGAIKHNINIIVICMLS